MTPITNRMASACLLAASLAVSLPGSARAATNDVPWRESFEGYAPGQSLQGTNGWSVSAGGGAVVTNLTYAFTNSALPLATNHTRVLERWDRVSVDVAAAATNVFCDMMIYAGQRRNLATNVLDASARTAFGVDTNGLLNVWHQTDTNADGVLDGAVWTALAHAPLASNAWARVTLAMDTTSDTTYHHGYVQVRLHGYTLTHAAAFARPDGSLVSGGSWFLMGGSVAAPVTNIEFNGYGKSDDLAVQYIEPWPSPVASNDAAVVLEGVAALLSPLANDTDPDGDPLTLQSFTAPAHGVAIAAGAQQIQYTASSGYVGADSFTYVVADVHGWTATGTVSLTVATRPPVASNDTFTVTENVPAALSVLANDSDPAGDALALQSFTQPAHGTAAATGTNQVLYTPAAHYVGADAFSYVLVDAYGATATGTVSLTLVTQPPLAAGDAATLAEGVPALVSPLANDSDPDGDTLTLQSFTQPAHGTAAAAGTNQVLVTPATGYVGADAFTYIVADQHGATATGSVALTIVTRSPVAVGDAMVVQEGVPALVSPLANDSDPAGDALTLQSFTQPAHGVTAASGTTQVQYTATAGYVGADAFTYVLADAYGATATGTVNVTVQTRPPVAVDDAVEVLESVATVLSPLANDSDPAGDAIALLSFTQPAHGAVAASGTNQVLYTPAAGYVGPDAFTYTVLDAYGAQASAAVTVSVLNQMPVAVDDAVVATQGEAVVIAPLANDSDPAGDAIALSRFTQPAHGVAAAAGGDLISYTAVASFTGTDTFQYVLADVHGGMATGTVTVSVRPYLANPLPWRDAFETYAPGQNLVGTNGWSGPGTPLVTNMPCAYPYADYLPLPLLTHTQLLKRMDTVVVQVSAPLVTNVYCDMMIRPGYRRGLASLALDAAVRAAVGVDTNGFLNVWHETDSNADGTRDGGVWSRLGHVPLASNEWARVTLVMDNTSDSLRHYRYVQVCLNQLPLESPDAYGRPDGALSAGGTWFIMGGTNAPPIEGLEFNGYGYSDDVVIGYGAPRFVYGSVFRFR